MTKKQIVGFSGFRPKYSGSVNEHPQIRAILENRPIEEIIKETETKRNEANSPSFSTSEYGYRYQSPIITNAPEMNEKEKLDPWSLEARVQAELNLPQSKIDLSRGAVPGYKGHIPRIKYRFGESYGSLSTSV